MKTKGFTLVELLVVIAILAILATVSVVGYTSYITSTEKTAAETEAASIHDAIVIALIANPKASLELEDGSFLLFERSGNAYTVSAAAEIPENYTGAEITNIDDNLVDGLEYDATNGLTYTSDKGQTVDVK